MKGREIALCGRLMWTLNFDEELPRCVGVVRSGDGAVRIYKLRARSEKWIRFLLLNSTQVHKYTTEHRLPCDKKALSLTR